LLVAASLLPKELETTITTINMDLVTDEQLAAIAFGGGPVSAGEEEEEASIH
jgi:hypothetical protein